MHYCLPLSIIILLFLLLIIINRKKITTTHFKNIHMTLRCVTYKVTASLLLPCSSVSLTWHVPRLTVSFAVKRFTEFTMFLNVSWVTGGLVTEQFYQCLHGFLSLVSVLDSFFVFVLIKITQDKARRDSSYVGLSMFNIYKHMMFYIYT